MVVGFAYVSLLVIFGWVTQRDSVTSAVAGVDARLQKRYSLWFDGGSRVLQGKAAAGGYVIRDELGCMQSTKATTKIRTLSGVDDGVVAFGSCYFGLDINHHAAEYMALIEGLYRVRRLVEQDRLAESSVGHSLFIEGDANMVIKPLQKRLSVASATEFELNKYHSMVQALQSSLRIGTVSLRHVKRNLNAEADKYANVALDSRQTLLYSRLHQRSPNLTDHEVAESSSNDAAEYVGPAGGVLLLRLQPSSHSRSQSLSAARVPVALEVNGLSITVRPFVRGTERGYKTREAKDEVALNSVAVDLDTEHYRQPGSALGSVGDGDADADPRPRSRVLVYQENLSPFISGAGAQAAISDSSFPLDDCSGLTGGYGGYDPHAAELEEAPSTSNDLRGIPILQRPLDTLQPSVQRVGRSREGAGESSIWHHLAIPYVSKRDVAAMNADLKAGVTPLTSSAASSEGMPTPDPSGMRSGPGHHRNASSCITVSIAYVSARSCLATEGTDDLPTLHRLAATSPDTLRRSLMRTANGVSGVTEAPVGAPLEAPIRASEQHDIEASPSPPSNPHVNPHDEAAHVHESYGDEFVIEEVMRGLARRGVLSQALALSVNVTAATGATASGEAPSVVALTPLQLSLLTGNVEAAASLLSMGGLACCPLRPYQAVMHASNRVASREPPAHPAHPATPFRGTALHLAIGSGSFEAVATLLRGVRTEYEAYESVALRVEQERVNAAITLQRRLKASGADVYPNEHVEHIDSDRCHGTGDDDDAGSDSGSASNPALALALSGKPKRVYDPKTKTVRQVHSRSRQRIPYKYVDTGAAEQPHSSSPLAAAAAAATTTTSHRDDDESICDYMQTNMFARESESAPFSEQRLPPAEYATLASALRYLFTATNERGQTASELATAMGQVRMVREIEKYHVMANMGEGDFGQDGAGLSAAAAGAGAGALIRATSKKKMYVPPAKRKKSFKRPYKA